MTPPQSIGIAEIVVDPITGVLYHSESRPSEKGRNAIVHTEDDTDIFDLGWNARTGVHEYGGAAFCVHGGKVYFSDIKTGRIHRIDGQGPVPVSPGELPLLAGSSTGLSEGPRLIQRQKTRTGAMQTLRYIGRIQGCSSPSERTIRNPNRLRLSTHWL